MFISAGSCFLFYARHSLISFLFQPIITTYKVLAENSALRLVSVINYIYERAPWPSGCPGLAGFVLGGPEFKSSVPLVSTFEVNQLGFLFSLQWSHIHQPCSTLRDRRVGETEKARTKREQGTGCGNTVTRRTILSRS